MIKFTRQTLDNGLRVIVHRDASTPMAVVNMLYDAGSRDEQESMTGLAHLLEHLMFGGSANIPSYDREVRKAGGENNAYTSNDITDYYVKLPAANLETGLWLESDRMLDLNLTQKGLDIQRNVVMEEFRQRYLNQPYGDMWMILRPLAYKKHPYRWPVIGKDISHIENITLEEVKTFYNEHYCPSNAILSITGNVEEDKCFSLARKWFESLGKRKKLGRRLPSEPIQRKASEMSVIRDVPYHEIIMVFRMCSRDDDCYYTADLMSDLLSGGRSSRLYRNLVMESKIFSSINAYITGDRDPGLFVVRGRLNGGVAIEEGHEHIKRELNTLIINPPGKRELDKVKNKYEATKQYAHSDILHKATDLAYYELLGDADLLNKEIGIYRKITSGQIEETARKILDMSNSSTLFYKSNQKSASH